MEEKTLVFDDWAMYLIQRWLRPEPDQAYNRPGEHEERFNALMTYLCYILQYHVSRNRYGYENYLTITLDIFHYTAILRISDYVAVHGEIPHIRGGGLDFFQEFGKEMTRLEFLLVDSFFKHSEIEKNMQQRPS